MESTAFSSRFGALRHSSQPTHRVVRAFCGLVLAALLVLGGCGAGSGEESATTSTSTGAMESDSASAGAAGGPPRSELGAPTNSTAPVSATAQLIQLASAVPRRIIYNATVDLIADNFPASERNLLALVKTHQGYIAETNVSGTPGTARNGSWKIRVPETQFAAFMAAVVKLGELQTTHTDSQDVTAEFTDLQARISNKQVEEGRLVVLLKRPNARLTDILQVERELSRVRGEIEQMQGRLRLLANQSALATVTVTLREVKGYVAPKPATFGSEISRTFSASVDGMREMGKGLFLIAVALAPWLVVLTIIGLPMWAIARRGRKKS